MIGEYNNRPIKRTLDPILAQLHEILLLVENDEQDYRKGYNWNSVKNKITKAKIADKKEGSLRWLEISDQKGNLLKLFKQSSIASQFLKNWRDAFAHNHVDYSSEDSTISISLLNKSGKHMIEGNVDAAVLTEIIELIKLSRISLK